MLILHITILFRRLQRVSFLLLFFHYIQEFNAVDICNLDGRTALHWACAIGNLQVVTILVEFGGAQVNICDGDGATPLHAAAAAGHAAVVKYLLLL